jgi:hypothetical protein
MPLGGQTKADQNRTVAILRERRELHGGQSGTDMEH